MSEIRAQWIPPRNFPDMGDVFQREAIAYFRSQLGVMNAEIGPPNFVLPVQTGWLRANTFVETTVDSSVIGGDDLVEVGFYSYAEYAPYVKSLPRAIDLYLEDTVYPRWKRDIESLDLDDGLR